MRSVEKMETVDENEQNVLHNILNEDELKQVPDGIKKKLGIHFNTNFEEFITAKAVFESNRKNLEQNLEKAQKELIETKSNFDECNGKLELAVKYTTELEVNLKEVKSEVHKLQESVKRLEKENGDLRKQRDEAADERDTLRLQVERRDFEIERMHTELSSFGNQLQTAVAAKCQALAEAEEVRSRDMTLDFKEKRLEQERALFSQQIAGLEEELSKRTGELQATRAEASARTLMTDTRLSQRDEELRIANESAAQLRESHSSLQRRCEELSQKLEEQRTQEISMHASYREEIGAQTRLTDLYKGMADEANAKAEEFISAVKELQELLEHATEQFGELETKYNQLQLQHNQDLQEKEQQINELTKELENANELLKNIKQERLDQAVEQLAPTAAIASRILKKGLSLTQIYTQLVDATNELTTEREENERLKSQMDVILRELEDKAPVLQQQREDYEAATNHVTTLTAQLDELLAENHRLQESADEANRLSKHYTKENQKLKSELADLARQVCYLLKEVQENRVGNSLHTNEFSTMNTDDLASSQIITKKLVTFKDIEELQENNQKLLSIVRTLSSRQEEMEKATDEINSGEMKEKLDRYLEQLAEMQAAQDRQAKMLDGLLRQRDMYKNMYQQSLKQSSTTEMKDLSNEENKELNASAVESISEVDKSKDLVDNEKEKEWKRKYEELENKLKQVTDEFELYRKEKIAHEKMLGEEVERHRKKADANSACCCRLKAQLDSANARFQLLQANVASYKSQIKALEEKCCNYNITIGKHEQSIMILKDEALSAQTRLSRAEVQLDNLRQERQLLRDSEGRLLKEREVFQRERQTQALLRADVESIKACLERVQAENQLRVEQRFDDATRECAALRRRLQEEQDRFRELLSTMEKQLNTAQERLKEEREITERIRKELEEARKTEAENSQKLEEANAKLRQAVAHSISKPFTGDENMAKRLKELEMQLATNQAEVKSLTEQLKTSRQQGQQYCDIAESAEVQLRELTEQHNKCKEELENALKQSRVEVISLQKRVKELGEELAKISSGRQETDSELRQKLAEAERKLEELDEVKGELELVKSDLQVASTTALETEEKYTREMVLHSADLQLLAKFKEEVQNVDQKMATLTQERNAAVEALELEKAAFKERETKLIDEVQETLKRVEDLDAQNSLLHDQIQELSDKTAIMQSQQSKGSSHESPDTSIEAMNRSFSITDEDSKSAEQLLKVMKYLRREKDLAMAKFDVLRAENLRLKSQAEVAEKRLKETETILNSEREKSEIDVVTTSKHAELLRKIETLNAITDSNRILREERDSLTSKVNELSSKVTILSEELVPLRDTSRDLAAKNEALTQENTGLKGEATRWRQRANALVERANKASPEDWRRLQTERESLSKLLTSERETHAKRTEELNQLKLEKSKLEEQLSQLQKQVQIQGEQVSKISEEARKLGQDLNEALADSTSKAKDLATLRKELGDKEVALNDIKNKEIQIRKIAKKYKTQFEELAKTVEEEKNKSDDTRMSSGNAGGDDSGHIMQEREDQLREEGRQELRQANVELTTKIDDLTRQISVIQSESESLKKEIDTMNKTSVEKEERAKQVLKGARTKIMQLTESKKICEKELVDLKTKIESGSGDSDTSEHDARLAALKSQMEGRISRLEHEKTEIQAEKEALVQRITQLQRQLTGISGVSPPSEPPTANIKPMSARAETPLASIRPMSVVQSRTAAVLPTTATAPVMVAPHQQQQPQQQIVHTTETSSPTSSLTDFQPASTSSSSQTTPSTLRQLVVQPQLSESAESTQREDAESGETLNVQQQQCQQQQQQQQQQQTVALVSPRVEQQQQQQQAVASDQQQTVASSSTQSVSTSQASTGHKRPRTLDSTASGSGIIEDHSRQEQAPSPKAKRSRQTELGSSASASLSEIEYQVPTSSQRDQDEEVEEGCVVIVDCDEGEGGGNNQAQEEEEFDNDPYEEMEEEDEMPYEVEAEVERDSNEVEIIMEEDSASVEVPRQAQATIPVNQQQQQSEAISSAGQTGEPATSFTSRSSRGIAPMPRQQQQQHLLLPQQGYEDGGDDSIVPSTPTLFVPRRGDGFGEAVSSPQVPQARFTFGDSSASNTASSTPSLTTTTGTVTRTIFGSLSSGAAQVVQESIDDSRIDLAQLEDGGTGRSVPTTPLQVSPAADLPPSTSSGPSEEQETLVTVTTVPVIGASVSDTNEESAIVNIRVVSADQQQQQQGQTEAITESSTMPTEGVSSEGEKRTEEAGSLVSGDDDAIDTGEGVEEPGSDIVEDDTEEESREAEASPSSNTRQRTMAAAAAAAAANANGNRGTPLRRSARSPFRARGARPTPIVWESQSGRGGQNVMRGGHATRGTNNEGGGRGRGTRGRGRMRAKYPYARF